MKKIYKYCIQIVQSDNLKLHPLNASFLIEVTEGGIDTFAKYLHPSNDSSSIIAKEDGSSNVIFAKEVQSLKAHFPIVVIDDGIITSVNKVQLQKQ